MIARIFSAPSTLCFSSLWSTRTRVFPAAFSKTSGAETPNCFSANSVSSLIGPAVAAL